MVTKSLDAGSLADLIRRPLVNEKATLLLEENKYIFEVSPKATKSQIKTAIESLFDVKVTQVNTMCPPRKSRRVGRTMGYRPHYKRAIVTLDPEDSIVLFPEV